MYAQARPTVNSPLPPIGQRATISVTDLNGGVTANDLVQNLVGVFLIGQFLFQLHLLPAWRVFRRGTWVKNLPAG